MVLSAEYRRLTNQEWELLDRLLEAPFQSRDEIRAQLEVSQVQVIDSWGSLRIMTPVDRKAHVVNSVPTEAEAQDADGVTIHVLLHVTEGVANLLEFYKDDGSAIIRLPPAEQWLVTQLPPPPVRLR